MEDDQYLLVTAPSGSLPDELIRRLSLYDPAANDGTNTSVRLGVRLFCQERHDAGDASTSGRGGGHAPHSQQQQQVAVVHRWRQREKLKTTAVALVLCLNIGVDPPDVVKISPCARLECWVDPLSMQPAKALETIGKNLQAQYERWQPRAKYRMHLDPTLDDVKKLAASCRRTARGERVLFHYNGHGVPRPTANGEIWVFNARYTQYIPLSVYELQAWLGAPAIYVLDCSAAGLVIGSLKALMGMRNNGAAGASSSGSYDGGAQGGGGGGGSGGGGGTGGGAGAVDPMREIIVLAACGANELLPQSPDLPADVFTACLTTPIKVALRWFVSRSLLRHDGVTKELIDRIPGRQTDRKTPLGELNWVFTAVTDTIAWNSLPRATFQKLFRQDLLVASLFRNFLLAERILTAANATPVSWPRLPPTHQHPLWAAWDMAAEVCLLQLPKLLADPNAEFTPSPFFSEQLTAFELWLAHGSADKRPPEQLPIVLQVLLSQVHRLRALVLLGRFLDMGPWAVDLALSVGIFPYVLKLLQTTSPDLRATLVFIWAKVLALDASCQADLVKDGGHLYFLRHCDAPPSPGAAAAAAAAAGAAAAPVGGTAAAPAGVAPTDHHSRAQAVFVLATVCDGHPRGQALCLQANLLGSLLRWLQVLLPGLAALEAQQQRRQQQQQEEEALAAGGGGGGINGSSGGAGDPAGSSGVDGDAGSGAAAAAAAVDPAVAHGAVLLAKWCCLALGRLVEDAPEAAAAAMRDGAPELLSGLLGALDPELRAAAVFALGCLVHSRPRTLAPGVPPGQQPPQPHHHPHDSRYADGGVGGESAGSGAMPPAAAPGNAGDGSSGGMADGLGDAAAAAGGPAAAALLEASITAEQSIAALLLRANVVYDASALVRCELASALARLVRGHAPRLEDAVLALCEGVSARQRRVAELLRAPAPLGSGRGSAGAAGSGAQRGPDATSSDSSSGGGGGGGIGVAGSFASPGLHASWHGAPGGGGASGAAAPGGAADGGGGGGGLYVPEGSRIAAAAAAAGIGGDFSSGGAGALYALLLETVLALATDPSPRVARLGREVLRLAQVELGPPGWTAVPTAAAAAAAAAAGYPQAAAAQMSPSSSLGGSAGAGGGSSGGLAGYGGASGLAGAGSAGSSGMGASLGTLTSKLVKGGRSWRSGFAAGAASGGALGAAGGGLGVAATGSGGGIGAGVGSGGRLGSGGASGPAGAPGAGGSVPGSVSGSPPSSPTARDAAAAAAAQVAAFARQHYTLRSTAADGGSACFDGGDGPSGAATRQSSGGTAGPDDDAAGAAAPPPRLPPSSVYAAAAERFSRPMLEPQAGAWRELEAAKAAPWTAPQDGARKAQRLREMGAARARCRGATNPRLREQVSAIETGAESVTALVFHSFHLLLVSADARGALRVQNAADGSLLNAFHASNGASLGDASAPPASLVYLRQLNEAESNLLLTCAADGAVRVWRSYLHNGNQRLAAAWQAVPMRQPSSPLPHAAVYALTDSARAACWLYAAGGSHPDVLQRWDLVSEMCAQQIAVRGSGSGSGSGGAPVAIEHLSVSQNDPRLILAGCSDQMLRLFDVRAGAAPAVALHAGRGPLAGLALEPCGRAGTAVTGSSAGELRFLDLRGGSGGFDSGGGGGGADVNACLLRSVQAHSAGGMSVLAAHPNAPLLATATASAASVVKVWTDGGDLVGAIRGGGGGGGAAPGRAVAPVTAMAWHPYNLYLGAGGRDSVASVFIVDHVPVPAGGGGGGGGAHQAAAAAGGGSGWTSASSAAAASGGSSGASAPLPPLPQAVSSAAAAAGLAGASQQQQQQAGTYMIGGTPAASPR